MRAMIDSFLFTILVDKFEVCKRNWVVRMVSPNIPVFIFNSFMCAWPSRENVVREKADRHQLTPVWVAMRNRKKCENNPAMKMPMGFLENEELK